MKGKAHLKWLQLLQLNKCGWMIISFPPRNKGKKKEGERRQHWIITQSKQSSPTLKSASLANLSNTSAGEMAFWAQPTGAVGPLCLGPRGRPRFIPVRQGCCWVAEDTASEFPPTELGYRPPESTALSQPSKTCPAIPPRRQNQPSVSPTWRAFMLAHNL